MWSAPSTKKKFDGDLDEKYLIKNFYTYFLSALLAKYHGHSIDLICDENTLSVYGDIPYNNISVVDFENDGVSDKFWIYGKIKAHTLMNEPYIHVDGDVLLINDIDQKSFSNAGVVVQQVENHKILPTFNKNYLSSLPIFEKVLPEINWNKYGLVAYNCGVVGFTNMKLQKKYAEGVQEILQKLSSYSDFKNVREKYAGMFLIAEQSYLYLLLQDENIAPLEVLEHQKLMDADDSWVAMNKIAQKKGYIHLWASSKYRNDVIEKIRKRIKRMFPEYYHILEKFELDYKDAIHGNRSVFK
jgi:hypothetical protein